MAGFSPCGLFKLPGAPAPKRVRKRRSKSPTRRSGLVFPVEQIQQRFRKSSPVVATRRSAIYVTAVIQYLATKVILLSEVVSQQSGFKDIFSRHIKRAIRRDPELNNLVKKKFRKHNTGEPGNAGKENNQPRAGTSSAAVAEDIAMQAGPSTSRACPSTSRAGPSTSRAGPSTSRAGPSTSRAGPSTSRARPSTSRAGPSVSRAGPSTSRAGPSTSRAGPSTSRAGNNPQQDSSVPTAEEILKIREAIRQAAFAAAQEDLLAIQQGCAQDPASAEGDTDDEHAPD